MRKREIEREERRGKESEERRERERLARATIPDGRTKGRQRGWPEGLEGCLGRDAVGVSQDWLFANVKLTSTLPPTHVVRTFAPRVLRLKVIPVSLASKRASSVTTRGFFFRKQGFNASRDVTRNGPSLPQVYPAGKIFNHREKERERENCKLLRKIRRKIIRRKITCQLSYHKTKYYIKRRWSVRLEFTLADVITGTYEVRTRDPLFSLSLIEENTFTRINESTIGRMSRDTIWYKNLSIIKKESEPIRSSISHVCSVISRWKFDSLSDSKGWV